MDWSPEARLNCLIGPGDSTKTTILDAIELALNPKYNFIGDDTDFHNQNYSLPVTITLTLIQIPDDLCADTRYGLHLRGWDSAKKSIVDEPGPGLEDALSVRVTIDPESLEGRWSIFNERLRDDVDPPTLRYKDARELTTTRLGPYAARHLGWGRYSALSRLSEGGTMNSQLALASRAARDAFRMSNKDVFAAATARAEKLGRHFSVTVHDKYTAELDVHGSDITAGGVVLHDGNLPLRTLGTGSSRLIVSALQHDTAGSHIALVDEIEHGLEPHRIARVLKYLRSPPLAGENKMPESQAVSAIPQVFMTSHSPVVIRELSVGDIHAVRCFNGTTSVKAIEAAAKDPDTAQRHLRSTPEAFLARRVLVGEGKTECGLMRGLDAFWVAKGLDSFAYQGVVAINGEGIPKALYIAQHLLDLGYEVLALLDSDEPPPPEEILKIEERGGKVLAWEGSCSTEQRMFLDVPWSAVQHLVDYAVECDGLERILHTINAAMPDGMAKLSALKLAASQDNEAFRAVLGAAAKTKGKAWFKDIGRAEHVAESFFGCLDQIKAKPFATMLAQARQWVDA